MISKLFCKLDGGVYDVDATHCDINYKDLSGSAPLSIGNMSLPADESVRGEVGERGNTVTVPPIGNMISEWH